MKKTLCCVFILVIFSGCSTKQAPLLFSSVNSFGLDVNPGLNGSPPHLAVGFKSADLAIVPTMYSSANSGETITPIRGCYQTGRDVGQIEECDVGSLLDPNIDKSSEKVEKSTPKINLKKASHISEIQDQIHRKSNSRVFDESWPAKLIDHHAVDTSPLQPWISSKAKAVDTSPMQPWWNEDNYKNNAVPTLPPVISLPKNETEEKSKDKSNEKSRDGKDPKSKAVPSAAIRGNVHQSILDSLSVFSSFEANAEVEGSKAGFGLGKMFATGAAAQHLTEGISIKIREGAGFKAMAITACISKLEEVAKSGKIKGTIDLNICRGN